MSTTRKALRSATPADPSAAPPPRKVRPAATGKTAPATPPGHKKHKVEPAPSRQKLIRDSYTIPKSEAVTLDALKLRAATLARPTKKSEILRAGIAALNVMSDKALLVALARVPSLKTGRPPTEAPPDDGIER